MLNFPDVHANDKAIPAGKVLLASGLPDKADFAREIVLDAKPSKQLPSRMIRLVAVNAGWAIAGSMLRWDNGYFGVRFEMDGSTHGRRFAEYEDAAALFAKWTGA